MNIKRKKTTLVLLILFFLFIFSGICRGEPTDLSVSVPDNPVRNLADQIQQTKGQLAQKKAEYQEVQNRNARFFSYSLGGLFLIITAGGICKSFIGLWKRKKFC